MVICTLSFLSQRAIYFTCVVLMDFLPPATKLGQGNILRSVCQEFCLRGGGESGPLHAGIHTPTPGPEAGTPPRHQRQGPLWTRPPPPVQCMLGDTGNKLAVRILLEWNLVFILVWLIHLSGSLKSRLTHISAGMLLSKSKNLIFVMNKAR